MPVWAWDPAGLRSCHGPALLRSHLRSHGPGGGARRSGAPFAFAGHAQRRPGRTRPRLGLPGPARCRCPAGHRAPGPGSDRLPRPQRDAAPQAGRGPAGERAERPGGKAGGGEHPGAAAGRRLDRHQHRCRGLPGPPAAAHLPELGRAGSTGAGVRRQCPGGAGRPGGAGARPHPGGRKAARGTGPFPAILPALGTGPGRAALAGACRGAWPRPATRRRQTDPLSPPIWWRC
jgi:translation initiation factor IF-2